ncbi:MAG: endolytic transglycosylase MltG [Candidatus Dormibacteraeota bacterium]|uniref:Endolytic murein transglycosylase n=1 Tax=Candidatus Aeolococcus gillhamiae TaxID=3127015 RepID=A0A934JST2_9BACT|nr:endolytic transglycosylase MltG [Candidatus Dormibacteraeota bacterium]
MRRGQHGRSGRVFAIVAVLVLLVVIVGGTLLYGRSQLDPPAATAGAPVTITVHSGETLDPLVADLAAHGLIRSTFWFGWFARLQGLEPRLVAGNFVLDDAMSSSYIVQRLEGAPQVGTHHLLLTEGLTAGQMAARVAAAGIGISADQYLAEVRTGTFSEPFLVGRPAGASLEGFLFPDTYAIPDHSTAHDIVQMQLADFANKAMPLLQGLSPQQLYSTLTVASIAEREAKFDADRPLVAGVVDDRLANGQLLQLDSTVTYGLGLSGGALTAKQLATDTPYNTYIHAGLPPTPISNPGVSSITAAAHPATTPYLFFISDCSGHNHYSVTELQHEQQIQQYLGKPC